MVKKVTTNLDSSKASDPDCIPVVVLKNCEPELSYILAKLFNKCLKESCFPDCWKVSSVVLVFKNVGERSTAKNYHPVSLLSVVSKVFEKLVNNRIVDHLEKCGLLSDFQYGFRSSRSTADLLTVVSDRIARAFNRSGTTRAVALDIFKDFDRVWHTGLLHKLKSYGTSGQIFGLISSFLSDMWLRVVLDGKSSQDYPVNAGVPQGSILGPTLFLLYINDLPDDVICNIAIYADDTTLYSKCDQASDLWQQLELASELESDLRDTVDWGRKWLVDFNAGKNQLVSFDRSKNTGAIDVKIDGSVLAQLVPLPYSRGRSTRYSIRSHDFSVTIRRCYKDVYVNSFFPRTARLWNSLPIECIECLPLTYDLSGFKSRINRYLLTVGSF